VCVCVCALQTVSARKERAAQRPLHVIDIPGHAKLRFRLAEVEALVGGVVYVIDAASVHIQLRQVCRLVPSGATCAL
jgi:translation elongation factor EF-4